MKRILSLALSGLVGLLAGCAHQQVPTTSPAERKIEHIYRALDHALPPVDAYVTQPMTLQRQDEITQLQRTQRALNYALTK